MVSEGVSAQPPKCGCEVKVVYLGVELWGSEFNPRNQVLRSKWFIWGLNCGGLRGSEFNPRNCVFEVKVVHLGVE